MSNKEMFDAYESISNYLIKAIAIVEPRILISEEAPHIALVKEALEHGEYGLALEDLSAILRDAKIAITQEVYDAMREAGTLMNQSDGDVDETVWKQLLPLIK